MRLAPARTIRFSLLATLVLAGPATVAAEPWPAFHFSTGTSFNHTVAVADLNADGKLDVAIPNSQASKVTVLLGNGDGTLAPFTAWPTHAEPQDVLISELTGDGIPDLATADYTGNGVTVLRGLGDGTFAAGTLYPTGPGLVSLAAVDLNGDGRLELVASKESNHKLAVLPALVGGGFGAVIEVATPAFPHQVNVADFDHDGRADLAVASYGTGFASVHAGNGTLTPGAAASFAAGAAPAIGLTPADLDGDGDTDLVISNLNVPAVSVLLGRGDGTFAAPVSYPVDPRPRGMDAGDLDGDGVPDLVVATGYPDGDSVLTVYRGAGDGTLVDRDDIRLPYRAADCVLADMNGDGRRDIVCTGPQAGVVTVLLNPTATTGVPTGNPREADLELSLSPNPVRASLTLRFRVPEAGRLEIFDTAGRRVADLGSFEASAESRTATWDGADVRGGQAPPGLYLACFTRHPSLRGGTQRSPVLVRRFALLPR